MKQLHVQFMYLILFLVYNVFYYYYLSDIQRQILEVLYSSFHLKIPQWTDDYRIAIASVGKILVN